MTEYKTIEGKCQHTKLSIKIFKKTNYSINKIAEVNNKLKLIDELISNECSENELYKFVTTIFLANSGSYLTYADTYDKLYKYIIDKSYLNIFNAIASNSRYDSTGIKNIVLTCTENIDLYNKFASEDVVNDIFLSLLYKEEPSILTEYIINNNELTSMCNIFIPCKYKYISNSDTCYYLIIYVIEKCNLAYGDVRTSYELYGLTTDNNCIKILELLLNNSNDKDDIAYDFLLEIMRYYSLDNFKYFINKYFYNINCNILIDILNCAFKLDYVQYLIEIIGHDKILPNYFDNYKDYDCIKWLYDQHLLLRPIFDVISDGNTVIMIVQNLINDSDFDYVKDNTRIIMRIIIDSNMSEQLMKIVPIKIFDLEIIFEMAALSECFNIIDILIAENYNPKCLDNVLHDLKLLDKILILDYIKKNFDCTI